MSIAGINAISPIAGWSSIAPIGGVDGLSKSAGTDAAPAINFADALGKVQQSIDNADVLSQQLATGELTDIHEYTVAASKAELGVQLTVAMRNQLLSAFQEVMRMQV
jgi:flagellar hook-basal body complex protein FliE